MSAFIPNPRLLAELEASAEVKEVERKVADAIAQEGQRTAPVVSGTFRDSIHVEDGPDGPLVVADPKNQSGGDYGAAAEFGTEDTPPHATLRRAAESVHL